MLLSLFCGAGGLDLGFERAGFEIGLAYDLRPDSIKSYNANRGNRLVARNGDVRELTPERLDSHFGSGFMPDGVIGGPPCQSFSRANTTYADDDPRHELPFIYASLLTKLNARSPIKFFVLENVPGLCKGKHHVDRYETLKTSLRAAGFTVSEAVLNAKDFSTPQKRERLFLVGLNATLFNGNTWAPPVTLTDAVALTVKNAIGGLPTPVIFSDRRSDEPIPYHPNHWCMTPRSAKFTRPGCLKPGDSSSRSFRTLDWNKPSPTIAYGHREVHVHPNCKRRLSVFEAMKLQGFPDTYQLLGSLSSQITQVSEAVPPTLAHAVATSVRNAICP